MTKRRLKKAAVIGSGIMGSRIACHFANIGLEVVLLDIVPFKLTSEEEKLGLGFDDKIVRNRIVNNAFANTLKSKPASLYKSDFKSRVTLGNIDDDLELLSDCDWILEAVIERLDIKQQVFEKIEKVRKPGTIITTNTSGIPIHLISEGRSEDFQEHFCGSHFFNPPRYLELLEIIPGPKTKPEVLEFLSDYGQKQLGKTAIVCKDTPAFIANRIGVYSIQNTFHLVSELKLPVGLIDAFTGTLIGRQKSATFRTCDVVGLDTLIHVANGLTANCPNDEAKEMFVLPSFIKHMQEQDWLGSKSGQGFYKKIKDKEGKSEILELNLESLEYQSQDINSGTLKKVKQIEKMESRIRAIFKSEDEIGTFFQKHFLGLFSYASHRFPEISDSIYAIDKAMKAGFGWSHGPFELWDVIGAKNSLSFIDKHGITIPDAFRKFAESDGKFYQIVGGKQTCFNPASDAFEAVKGQESFIILDQLAGEKTIWENSGSRIIDLGDGIINVEFRSKMNSLGGDVLEGVHKGLDLAESSYDGLVIGNQADHFSVGANLMMVFMMAVEQDYDELDNAIRTFQNTTMRLRYSSIPVVAATQGMTFGGGCETAMHADAVIAAAENYMGLVEFGVGLIPGGGGSKELAKRASDKYFDGDIQLATLKDHYLTIAMAKVSTSGHEAFDLNYLRPGIDRVVANKHALIAEAKKQCLFLADAGYQTPISEKVTVLGRQGLGMFMVGSESMKSAHFISNHDKLISEKLGFVMTGGDLSSQTQVSEQYLLDLEREAFLSLCGEKKTLERIEHMLKTGKPLRN
ncbi:MAG: 3-hydroxyacyl-CoA dehydrogenase [Flavobacteriales bacterium]|jgi:3-hydroxyacyl-CoA dehydrogenase